MTIRTILILAVPAALAIATTASAQFFGGDPLLTAIQEGSPGDVNDAVLTGESVHKKSTDGTPAIVLASHRRNADIVKVLLTAGARPNDAARDGETALTVAAGNGDDEIVALLLAAKADANKPGALRETPLIRAVRGQHAAVVKLLIEAKVDLDQTDSSGATALSIAEVLRDERVAALLRKAGAE